MIRFRDNSQAAALAKVIGSYLNEAKGYADSGTRPRKEASAIELPPELAQALASDAQLAEAFHSLAPGRQRSYVISLGSAKKPETRASRIASFRDRILAGRGALER